MLALIAGTGQLPAAIIAKLESRDEPYVVCEMLGFPVEGVPDNRKLLFRIEKLGSVLDDLRDRGVDRVCFAGAVRRPPIDPAQIDAKTMPLVPILQDAIGKGDDGALRAVMTLFEAQGFLVVAAHEIVPDLLPPAGVLTGTEPDKAVLADVAAAIERHRNMSVEDSGQAVMAAGGRVVASEGPDGTDAMIAAFAGNDPVLPENRPQGEIAGFVEQVLGGFLFSKWGMGRNEVDSDSLPALGGTLYKAPKTGQDRRADLPVIGPDTVELAARAGLSTIVIEAGGVMVLDLVQVQVLAHDYRIRIWVREAQG